MTPRPLAIALFAAAALALAGCARPLKTPDIGGLYNRAAQMSDLHRNPVIVLPGILGSTLVSHETGQVAWGAFSGDYANPAAADGARLIALPMRQGEALATLRDEVGASGALETLKIDFYGVPVEASAYAQIIATLGAGGYRDQGLAMAGAVDYGAEHFTCFQFAYDWRRDNVENAKLLYEFILEKKKYVEAETKRRYGVDRDVKFDVVAHSMGGLVTRWMLQYGDADLPSDGSMPELTWKGADLVDRAILVGTPSGGSSQAINQLVNGFQPAALLPYFSPAILGTMPAIYQLLPRTRHGAYAEDGPEAKRVDGLDPATWEKNRWGLASPDIDDVLAQLLPNVADAGRRRAIALDHQRKCLVRAARFHAAMDRPATPPAGSVLLSLIAGDAEPTPHAVAVDPATGAIRFEGTVPGDKTVPRFSALMDERTGQEWSPGLKSPIAWSNVLFLFADHIGLTKDPAFVDNILYLLLEAPKPARHSMTGEHNTAGTS